MEGKRLLRPVCVILAVLYALNGVYIVVKRALVALIERFSEVSAAFFVQGSSTVELILFTLCTGLCLLCAAFLTRGRLRAAFFVLTGAQAAVALGNLLPSFLQTDAMQLSLCVAVISACCTIVGYALLAHAGRENELCVIGWLCASLAGINQLCSALSIFSAMMLNTGVPALWFTLFYRTAQISSILSIIACIMQALCFVLLLFAVQRTASASAIPGAAAPSETQALTPDGQAASKKCAGPDESAEPAAKE